MKKVLCLCLVVSICFVGNAMGAAWNGGGGVNNLWSNGDNWSTGVPPVPGEDVFIDWGSTSALAPALIDSTVTGYGAVLRAGGVQGTPTTEYIEMTGGTLTLSSHMILGQGNGSTAYFNMSGGILTAGSIWTGAMTNWGMGTGLVTMTGGTINLNVEGLYVSRDGSPSGLGFELKGGLIDASGGFQMGEGGLMNIDTGGVLRLPDIYQGAVNTYISDGRLMGNGVVGNVVWTDNGDGTIDVTAVPEPATAVMFGIGSLVLMKKKGCVLKLR